MLMRRATLPMDAKNEVMIAPDFLALGLGGTNMMSMMWTVAMGRQAVGVEMRGDPFLGVHWNIREDFYHQLGLIDQMMLERYGEERIPRRGDGRIFRLAECFYSPHTAAGDIVADEIIDGFDADQHIVGTIHDIEFIDDRWRDGLPNRVITVLDPPTPPDRPDPEKIRNNMVEVLDGPSTFQAEAASIQKLLRRYLELIEQQDLVQVPDFKTFDPIESGLLPAGTDPDSPEFFATYQHLIYEYYMKQAADTLDIPRQELMKVQMIYGPTLFSLIERVGDDPLIATICVVDGDSFGNGHYRSSF